MKQGYLYLDDHIFETLLAVSSEEQEKGLMYQDWPPPAMAFVYGSPQLNRFWMKNTPSPLDIIFCCGGQVLEICRGVPHSTEAVGSVQFSDLVVELPYGTAKAQGISIGSKVGFTSTTIAELQKLIYKKHG